MPVVCLLASHATDLVLYVDNVVIHDWCWPINGKSSSMLVSQGPNTPWYLFWNHLVNHHSFYLLNIVHFFCVKFPLRHPSLDVRISFVCTVQRWATQYWEIPHMAFVEKLTLMAASVTTPWAHYHRVHHLSYEGPWKTRCEKMVELCAFMQGSWRYNTL